MITKFYRVVYPYNSEIVEMSPLRHDPRNVHDLRLQLTNTIVSVPIIKGWNGKKIQRCKKFLLLVLYPKISLWTPYLFASLSSYLNRILNFCYYNDDDNCLQRMLSKKERKKERKSIFPNKIYKLNQVPVGLKECSHIRKLLSRNHLGKVPSKTGKCWKMKGPQNMSNWYFKLFEVSFALSIVKIQKLIFSALQD